MTLEEKLVTMNALLHLIEAERLLREKVPQVRDELPELWKAQIDGVKAERNDPKWQPTKRMTLDALIPMLALHLGQNKALNYLPRYPDQYEKLINIRNAIGHGDWDELAALRGSAMAPVKTLSRRRCFSSRVDGNGRSECTFRRPSYYHRRPADPRSLRT
jgi:hypothetical protein